MKIYLVRHGQSVANTQGLVCGQEESPLTELGRDQAKRLHGYLKENGLFTLPAFVSPQLRARDTARIAMGRDDLELIPELKEINTGDYSPYTYDELYRIDPRFRSFADVLSIEFPNGESILSFRKRVLNWFHPWIDGREEDLILFSHSYTLNVLIHENTATDMNQFPLYPLPNASLVVMNWGEAKPPHTLFVP